MVHLFCYYYFNEDAVGYFTHLVHTKSIDIGHCTSIIEFLEDGFSTNFADPDIGGSIFIRAHVFSVCLMASANSSHRGMEEEEEEKMKCLNFHPPSQPEAMVCNLPTHHLSCKPFGQTTSLLSIYIARGCTFLVYTFQFLFNYKTRDR